MAITKTFLEQFDEDTLSKQRIVVQCRSIVWNYTACIAGPVGHVLYGTLTEGSQIGLPLGREVVIHLSPVFEANYMLGDLLTGFDGFDPVDHKAKPCIAFENARYTQHVMGVTPGIAATHFDVSSLPTAKPFENDHWSCTGGILRFHDLVAQSVWTIERDPIPGHHIRYRISENGEKYAMAMGVETAIATIDRAVDHRRQLAAMPPRKEITYPDGEPFRALTPFGDVVKTTVYGSLPGGEILLHSARHGDGFQLSQTLNKRVHPLMRRDDGFYEADRDYAAVVEAFKNENPPIFTRSEIAEAERIVRNLHPRAYEELYGRKLLQGESIVRDLRGDSDESSGPDDTPSPAP